MEQVGTAKLFFDVFPTLKVEDSVRMLFLDVEVKKITTNSTRDFLHIYIFSRHLFRKHQIWQMEQKIKEQLFGTSMVNIHIEEEYSLSEQYTPAALMAEYRESISQELRSSSVLAANMFDQAKLRFEEERVCCLELADTIVSEGRKEQIVNLLDEVFNRRCGVHAEFRVTYREKPESRTREFEEQRIQREINAIFRRNQSIHGGSEGADSGGYEAPWEETGADVGVSGKQAKAGRGGHGIPGEGSGNGPAAEKGSPSGKGANGSAGESKSGIRGGRDMAAPGKNGGGNGNPAGRGGFSAGRAGQGKNGFRKESGRDYVRPLKLGDAPGLIYGRDFEDEPIRLDQVATEMGEITLHGKVISFETREIRNERTIIIFSITDFTDTITVKMFVRNEQLAELLGDLKKGAFLKIKGVTTIDKYDGELTIGSIAGIKKTGDFTVSREDLSPVKRVELHCHTKMSDMDGVSEVKDIVGRAHKWGHPAIAITDHGTAQAFPDANHYIERLDKADPFKVIYGVEGYVVDDLTEIAPGAGEESLDDTFVVFDLETTGFSAIKDKIIEIGAVKVARGEIVDSFSTFVNPRRPIPFEITKLTGITDEMVMEYPDIETILPRFLEFIGDAVLVAHNAGFDVGFIEQNCRYQDIEPRFISVDTVALARVLLPTLSKYKLNVVAKALNISLENHHRAVDDAGATAEIFVKFVEMLKDRGITRHQPVWKYE